MVTRKRKHKNNSEIQMNQNKNHDEKSTYQEYVGQEAAESNGKSIVLSRRTKAEARVDVTVREQEKDLAQRVETMRLYPVRQSQGVHHAQGRSLFRSCLGRDPNLE